LRRSGAATASGVDIWDCGNPRNQTFHLKVFRKFGAKPTSQQNHEQLIKAISFIKATGKCEKRATIIVIASNGFFRHFSPAVDGMVGEDKNEMGGVTKADGGALSKTKKKWNKKCLRGHKRVFYLLQMVDCKVKKVRKVGGAFSGLEFGQCYNIIKQNLTTQDETLQKRQTYAWVADLVEKHSNEPSSNARL
jgi:hypothetical protein